MTDDNDNRWLISRVATGDDDVSVEDHPDEEWTNESDGYVRSVRTRGRETSVIVVDDSNSETDSNRIDERMDSVEDSDGSDFEVGMDSPSENVQRHWEPEALNVDSVLIIEREDDIVQEPSVVSIPENPNAGVENPIIRLENPDYEPEECQDSTGSEGSAKRSYGVMISEDDDGQTCPVCLDVWTNAGVHRLSSLKCGHLFGKSCIARWLSIERKKYCPQCNKKANVGDIRELYATKLTALDATEKNRLEKELEEVKEQKRKLEQELLTSKISIQNCKQQLVSLREKMASLQVMAEGEKHVGDGLHMETVVSNQVSKFHLEKTIEIQEGSCRVCAYSSINNSFVLSHQSRNQIFRGFGVKMITKIGAEFSGYPCLVLHLKALRDLCFHPVIPNLILTVSFDKTAKLADVEERKLLQTYKTNHPLWSCCWDQDDTNIFYVGASNGNVYVYDMRTQGEPVAFISPTDDCGAVVALRYAPENSTHKGVLICCRLNSVVLYVKTSSTEYNPVPLPDLIGPFFSMSYDSKTRHLLVSCRPSEEHPKVRHVYCELNGTSIHRVFWFCGGTRQTLMCRSCFLSVNNEVFFAAFHENLSTIELWSVTNGSLVQVIPVKEQILDLISINMDNKNFLGAISDTAVRFYQRST